VDFVQTLVEQFLVDEQRRNNPMTVPPSLIASSAMTPINPFFAPP
jgi:hypothetical protein